MKNKNRNIYLYSLIIIVILLGAFLIYKLAFAQKNTGTRLLNIQVSELEEKINAQENFVLVISQTGCSHCEQYLPELDRALQEVNFNAYVLNITGLDKTNSDTLAKYVNFSGTPTTIFFHEGIEKTTLNRIVGYASKTKIIERLKSLGYVD